MGWAVSSTDRRTILYANTFCVAVLFIKADSSEGGGNVQLAGRAFLMRVSLRNSVYNNPQRPSRFPSPVHEHGKAPLVLRTPGIHTAFRRVYQALNRGAPVWSAKAWPPSSPRSAAGPIMEGVQWYVPLLELLQLITTFRKSSGETINLWKMQRDPRQ